MNHGVSLSAPAGCQSPGARGAGTASTPPTPSSGSTVVEGLARPAHVLSWARPPGTIRLQHVDDRFAGLLPFAAPNLPHRPQRVVTNLVQGASLREPGSGGEPERSGRRLTRSSERTMGMNETVRPSQG